MDQCHSIESQCVTVWVCVYVVCVCVYVCVSVCMCERKIEICNLKVGREVKGLKEEKIVEQAGGDKGAEKRVRESWLIFYELIKALAVFCKGVCVCVCE